MTKALYFVFGVAVGVGIGSVSTYLALKGRLNASNDMEYAEEEKSLKTENTASERYSEDDISGKNHVFIPKNGVKYRDTLEELKNTREEIKEDELRKYEEKTKIYRSLEDDERMKREIDRQIKEESEVGKVIFKSNEVISEDMYDKFVKEKEYGWDIIEAISDGEGNIVRYQYENGNEIPDDIFRDIEDEVSNEILKADYDVGAFVVDHKAKKCYQIIRIDPDYDEKDDPDKDLAEIPDELEDIDEILSEEVGSIPGYNVVALWYYIPDQVVIIDEDNSEMDDFEEHIGNNAISNFQDGTIKWIRNRKEHVDYVLTFSSEHYDPHK